MKTDSRIDFVCQIGLASATSQLDQIAWKRVATYTSISQKPGIVSSPYRTTLRKHRRIEENCLTRPAFTLLKSYSKVFLAFFLQVQNPCCNLSSCLVEPYRCRAAQHCCLDEHIKASRFLGLFFTWRTSLSLVLVGHSTGKNQKTMKRRQIHRILRHRTISMQSVWTKISTSRMTRAQSETATNSTRTLPNSQYLFNYEAQSKLSKCQNFLTFL